MFYKYCFIPYHEGIFLTNKSAVHNPFYDLSVSFQKLIKNEIPMGTIVKRMRILIFYKYLHMSDLSCP